MHIIFEDALDQLPDSFTILELDRFKLPNQEQVKTAYCVVEVIPLQEFPLAEAHKKIHADLISAYRNQHWNYCEQAIEALLGKWNGEVDTFYTELLERVKQLRESELPADWDGTILKGE